MAKEQDEIDQARKAFGLKPEEVFAASERAGMATIVTVGGHKASWKPGMKVEPLHDLHAGRSIKPPEPPK